MKKSKKALLWSIVPILGISGGAAGAVAGITNHKASTSINSTVALNSADSLAKARLTNDVTNKLEITNQTYDVLVNIDGEFGENLFVEVNDEYTELDNLTCNWYVNRGEGWEFYSKSFFEESKSEITITVEEEVSSVKTWTFRCVVVNNDSGEKATSDDIKFTIAPWESEYIQVLDQPTSKQSVSGGQEVILSVNAELTELLITEQLGYRWFEYDSQYNRYTLIDGATESTYTFTAPFASETQTKKYVCRFYLKSNVGNYISESNQAIVTINKSEPGTIPEKTLSVSSSVKSNQASVRNNFYANNKVDGGWYTVDVKNTKDTGSNLVYQWYYTGRDGKEHLIEGTKNSNQLTPNRHLFEAAYKDNSNHRVGIVCKIYKDGKLDTVIDQKTNSSFYLNVVTNNRVIRVSK